MVWLRSRQTLTYLILAMLILSLSYMIFTDNTYEMEAVRFAGNHLQFLRSNALVDTEKPASSKAKERSDAIKMNLQKTCTTFNISLPVNSFMMGHMHYDDTSKAIYCFIPKVACTSWKRVWMKLTGIVPLDKDLSTIERRFIHTGLPLLKSNMESELKLKTYKKFIFVRHPFDRVLSAFKDKLESFDKSSTYDFHKEIGMKIQQKYREKTNGGHNVTFTEFIRYITESGPLSYEQRNEHWLSMHEICNPCAVQYDFIGKFETLKEDADYVLDWLGAKNIVASFPMSDRPFYTRRYDPKYFNSLDHKTKMKFFAKYLADFVAFDYRFL
nr:carbohydrate sulfotransferase 11-like [Cherax quadricarinatus]